MSDLFTIAVNCSRAYRNQLTRIAARGPTEAEARTAKVQREAERRRAKTAVGQDDREAQLSRDLGAVRTITGAEL